MSDPVSFDTASPRFALPLLFSGQSQKEVYVNEAHALIDALLHCTVESIAATPPAAPADGSNWLVGAAATGDWSGEANSIACRQNGNWIYVTPRDGMIVLNRGTGQQLRYFGGWVTATNVAPPTGGSIMDAEARTAISGILAALRIAGILATS
jgi:hypothetical protein